MNNGGKIMRDKSPVGFCGMLALVFIVMKLLGKIDWSWWWVLAPIWIPAALVVGIVFVVVVLSFIIVLVQKR